MSDGSGTDREGTTLGRVALSRGLTLLLTLGLSLGAVGVTRVWVAETFFIPSGSMEQTLLVGDRVLVEKMSGPEDVERGDVVVFDGAGTYDAAGEGRDYIKRVVARGGDTVECCDAGRVTVNGVAVVEAYVHEDDRAAFGPVRVPPGSFWVMGDHRSVSVDSRTHGPISDDAVVGRAVLRFWPLERFGRL